MWPGRGCPALCDDRKSIGVTPQEEYRRYAAECLELTSALQEPEARALMRHMAQVWVRLAQDAENRSPSLPNDANQPG
jgi:hypothetical protein